MTPDNRNLLTIAMDVHMTAAGSYDRPEEDQLTDIHILKSRLEKWEPSIKGIFSTFDGCCRGVIEAALAEVKYYEDLRSS